MTMTAAEAYRISTHDRDLKKILEKIAEASKKGKREIPIWAFRYDVMDTLKSLGYRLIDGAVRPVISWDHAGVYYMAQPSEPQVSSSNRREEELLEACSGILELEMSLAHEHKNPEEVAAIRLQINSAMPGLAERFQQYVDDMIGEVSV